MRSIHLVMAAAASVVVALENPFERQPWAHNPMFAEKLEAAGLSDHPAAQFATQQPSVVWMDAVERIEKLPGYMSGSGNATVFIEIYNLPDRDCAASSSTNLLHCDTPDGQDCLTTYKQEFLLPIRDILSQYPEKTKILFIETDSLPNSVTNYMNGNASPCQSFDPPKCSDTAMTVYYNGVIWALNELNVDDNTFFYLDAAHHGWLGWAAQQELDAQKRPTQYPDPAANGLAQLFVHNIRQILESTPGTTELLLRSSMNNAVHEYTIPLLDGGLKEGVAGRVRGFATNIANREMLLDRTDKCDLARQYNFCPDELSYVDMLNALWEMNGYEFGFVIDTSRNGGDDRKGVDCRQWCNVKSRHNPDGLPQIPDASKWANQTGYVYDVKKKQYKDNKARLDAFFWLKDVTSDGCSDAACTRFDCMCKLNCRDGFQFCDMPEAGEVDARSLEYWYNK